MQPKIIRLLSKLLEYEDLVDSGDGTLEIALRNADDDVQLARALVDHLYVNVCMSQRREYASRCAALALHAASYYRDKSEVCLDVDNIGVSVSVDTCKYLLLLLAELALMNYNAHGVDTRRHMLKGYTVLLELLQHLSAEAQLAVHHVLFDVYCRKALLARDTRDGVKRL